MFSSLCVVSLWRNNTFSMHMLTTKDQWVMMAKPPSRKVCVCRLVFFTRKVFTSCRADGFQICWSRHHLREQGSKYGRIYRTSSNKVSNLLFFTSLWAESSISWCKSIKSINKVFKKNKRLCKSIESIKSGLQIPAGRPRRESGDQFLYLLYFYTIFYTLFIICLYLLYFYTIILNFLLKVM